MFVYESKLPEPVCCAGQPRLARGVLPGTRPEIEIMDYSRG